VRFSDFLVLTILMVTTAISTGRGWWVGARREMEKNGPRDAIRGSFSFGLERDDATLTLPKR
jgi:hypothetical protein